MRPDPPPPAVAEADRLLAWSVEPAPVRAPLPLTAWTKPGTALDAGREAAEAEEQDRRAVLPLLDDLKPAPLATLYPAPRPCPGHVEQAQARYTEGAFDEAVALLSRCLMEGDPPPEEAVPAYRLLALAYSQKNDEAEAERAILHLLALAPYYEPDRPRDPALFSALVSDVKRALRLPSDAFQCDRELAEAHGLYVAGSFEPALQTLHACLSKPGLIITEAVWAHRLAALTHLRQSNLAAARDAVVAIIALRPAYRADPVADIPAYVALVDLVRHQIGEQAALAR